MPSVQSISHCAESPVFPLEKKTSVAFFAASVKGTTILFMVFENLNNEWNGLQRGLTGQAVVDALADQ